MPSPLKKTQFSLRSATEQMLSENQITIITLTSEAVRLGRIPKAEKGQTFVVEKFTRGTSGYVAHVRDFRYVSNRKDYQVWSLSADMYEIAYAVAL